MEKNSVSEKYILWQKASDETIVCFCQNVDKGTILSAIQKGAYDMKAIQQATTAGLGGRCKQVNPRKRCCHSDISELLQIYRDKKGHQTK